MPLIQCHECHGKVSDYARTCPHCGAPVLATIKRRQKAALIELGIRAVVVLIIGVSLWFLLQHLKKQVMAPLQNLQQQSPSKQ
jgi:hypothetical protein